MQRIFSFSLRSRAVHRSAPDKPFDYGVCSQARSSRGLSCWCYGASAAVVFPSSGLHTSDCTTSDCVASGHLPCALQHTKRVISLKEHSRVERLFKDAFHPCVSGCGRYLAPGDGHDRCLSCLGIKHAEAAFVDESCSQCGKMTVAELRTRLRFLQGAGCPCLCLDLGLPLVAAGGGATSGSSRTGLTVTVRNSPPRNQPSRAPLSTGTSQPVELPRELAGP